MSFYEQHIRTVFHNRKYIPLVAIANNVIHLEVPEVLPIYFRRMLVYAHSVMYPNPFPDSSASALQAVSATLVQTDSVRILILSNNGVDCLM